MRNTEQTPLPTKEQAYSDRQKNLALLLRDKAREFGADAVGFASVESLKNGPSERLFPMMKDHSRDHFAEEITTGLPHGAVYWEEEARTAVVVADSHPKSNPSLDWWCGEINPPGNKRLLQITKRLAAFLGEYDPSIRVWQKRYHVERGGIYLKDAAVMAGLGCIGRNNLLVTPEFGPRVRLRAMLISEALPPDGPIAYDPCSGCAEYCIRGCPQKAFSEVIYTREEMRMDTLPARRGDYFRQACSLEMKRNEDTAVPELMPEICDHPEKIIKYCRNCEFLCPAGSKEEEK